MAAFVLRRLPEGTRGRTRLLEAADRHLTRSSPLVRTRLRDGVVMHLDLRSRMESLAYFTGGHEDELIRAALAVMPPGGVAFDVGANIGFWTVPLAAAASTVHAYEPLRTNAERLRRNLAENGLQERVRIHPVGLSDAAGHATLRVLEDPDRSPLTGNAALDIDSLASSAAEDIALTTLDDHVTGLDLERIDLIKVDIEGHENAFFRGAMETIRTFRPVMWVEWNGYLYSLRDGDPGAEIAASLKQLDYAVLGRVDGEWQVLPTFSSPLPLDDLIAVPSERAHAVLTTVQSARRPR